MKNMKTLGNVGTRLLALSFACGVAFACSGKSDKNGGSGDGDGDDSRPPPGETGSFCETADECFPDVAEGELLGEAICLDRVDDGYCTHECTVDEDCCAVEGECTLDARQVCSPFESTGTMMCFLSCEGSDLAAAEDWDDPPEDESDYCQKGAGADFICRSSGGGAANRKVCVPGDCEVGADCVETSDCTGDLTCVTDFKGGYCTQTGCAADSECPTGSVCVDNGGDENICLRTCNAASDCSFCRAAGFHAACESEVATVEGNTEAVCVPELR